MKKVCQYSLPIAFALFLASFSIWDVFVSNRVFSEMENRYLQQRPKYSLSSLISGEYAIKYEEYINDQFVLRDGWISLKSIAQSMLGRIENNSIVYGRDGYMFERYPAFDEQRLESNLKFVEEFADLFPNRKISLSVIPNSYVILADKLPTGLDNVDQLAVIDQLYARLRSKENLTTIDLYPVLAQSREPYLFYRTDHHWTSQGAYLAYGETVRRLLGEEPGPLEGITAHEVPDFYGTYYSKSKKHNATPDRITYYDLPQRSVTIDGKEADGIYDLEKFSQRDKYAAFLQGNNGLTVIRNTEPGDKTPSRILLIKDSYGNCFAPYLTLSYDEVYIADLRSMPRGMCELVETTPFDDILILYNFMNFTSDNNFARLRF